MDQIPFKTTITLNFVRAWPFVLYALGLLDWIPRRKECGTPCQTCRYQCAYQAITPAGKIQYDECFQCLECVAIHASDTRCAPLMLDRKAARIIAIQNLST